MAEFMERQNRLIEHDNGVEPAYFPAFSAQGAFVHTVIAFPSIRHLSAGFRWLFPGFFYHIVIEGLLKRIRSKKCAVLVLFREATQNL